MILLCHNVFFSFAERQLTSTVISSDLIKGLPGIFLPAHTEFQKIYHAYYLKKDHYAACHKYKSFLITLSSQIRRI